MKDVAKKLKEHAAQPASKAHKGLRAKVAKLTLT
jgi:hypothetical protein